MKKFVAKSDIIVKDLILSKGAEVILNETLDPFFPPGQYQEVRIIVPVTDKISYSCLVGSQNYFNRNFEEVKN